MHAVYEALLAKRKELDLEEQSSDDASSFKVKLMGGKWCKENLGKDYDSYRGCCAGKAPESWCLRFNLPRSASFSIGKYGQVSACQLARVWSHRMQHLYNLFAQSKDQDSFAYTAEMYDNYVLEPRLREWASGLALKELARERFNQVLALRIVQ